MCHFVFIILCSNDLKSFEMENKTQGKGKKGKMPQAIYSLMMYMCPFAPVVNLLPVYKNICIFQILITWHRFEYGFLRNGDVQ